MRSMPARRCSPVHNQSDCRWRQSQRRKQKKFQTLPQILAMYNISENSRTRAKTIHLIAMKWYLKKSSLLIFSEVNNGYITCYRIDLEDIVNVVSCNGISEALVQIKVKVKCLNLCYISSILIFWYTSIVNWVKGHRNMIIGVLDLYIDLKSCIQGN